METMKSPQTETGVKKVLVVEDDVHIRAIVTRILERKGYLVLEAGDGHEAVERAQQADIILLDLFLPGMTGDEVMKKVRESGNYVPVVVMSAVLDRQKAVENCKGYGIVDFIEKPFKANELAEKIGKAAHVADDIKFVRKATDRLKGFIERQAKA